MNSICLYSNNLLILNYSATNWKKSSIGCHVQMDESERRNLVFNPQLRTLGSGVMKSDAACVLFQMELFDVYSDITSFPHRTAL